MNKFFIRLLLAAIACVTLASCKKQQASYSLQNDEYVQAISGTGIGRLSPIVVTFIKEGNVPLNQGISLSPEQKGEWEISDDNRTAIFKPSKPYKSNAKITFKADCKKLFDSQNQTSIYYNHDFFVAEPKYSVNFDEIFLDGKRGFVLTGNIVTDIPVSEAEISQVLKAKLGRKNQKISWNQSFDGVRWDFSIRGIQPSKKNQNFRVSWSGIKLGLTKAQDKLYKGVKSIMIPAENVFSMLDFNTSKANTILISFSKVLDSAQDVASFLSILDSNGKHLNNFNASVRGNVISIFNDSNFSNATTVVLEKGLPSRDGDYLAYSTSLPVSNRWDKPSVKFDVDNVILPTSQGAVLPIETKNLTGILVQVYEIYDRNITQFLQENELDETYHLNRVGEPVWEKKISFSWNNGMQNKFIKRGLDLSEITKKYPDGMFHVRVSFRKDQIKYICRQNHADFSSLPFPEDKITPYENPSEKSYWDWTENLNSEQRNSYYYYDDDPCHPAFYMERYNRNIVQSHNILVSDLGIIAKRDSSGKLFVTVADIKTAKPLSGIKVELKNYIGSSIASGKTNSDGNISLDDSDKTYIVVASNGKQASYLKISNSTSLSTSHFETGGVKADNGVKGFIYGERGVWRPGDTIYLTFVLQDLKKTLPANIPVTFELFDPMGRKTDSKLLKDNTNGFYSFETGTKAEDPTGLWTANVKIGGKTWSKYLSVETVVPNKLSVKLSSDEKYLKPGNNKFTLKGEWLHGAPTPNYRAEVSMALSAAPTNFDGYSDYTFTNLENSVDSSRDSVWEGKLDSSSKADFTVNFDSERDLPGKMKANFISKIFEPGGGFSSQAKSFVYSPYASYVGLRLPKGDAARNMLLTDTDHTASIVMLTPDGKQVPSGDVEYAVYKLEWKWWWETDAYSDATYVSSYSRNVVTSGTTTIANGRGSFQFNVKYPNWGRYLVVIKDVDSGHSASKVVYIDWPNWAGRSQEGGSSASMVPLAVSKKQYSVGETAEISFASSKGQQALVTIEKSGEIIRQSWLETSNETTVFRLPLTAEMTPNIYVHVTLLQQHLQTANSLPIRLYGVVPVRVENPATLLSPVITTPAQFEPNKAATVSVSEANGKPMTYTIAVVDEGLLGLTNYHSPSLRNEFYKKEASTILNWDIYKYVMSAYSGKLETILSVGGSDSEFDNSRSRDENRFAPVVKFFGPFTISAGEKKSTTFMMPNYVGAVRAMVIAGNNGAYGTTEKTVKVKSDLMVQASVPRTIGTNEILKLPITVFNNVDSRQNVKLQLSATGAMPYSKSVNMLVDANSSKTIVFELKTENAGSSVFTAAASTASASSSSVVPVEIMSRGVPVSYRTDFTVKPGKSIDVSVQSPGEKSSSSLSVELSSVPQINLANRLDYLTKYPHGCIEQITSGGFPQLFLGGFVKLSPTKINQIRNNIKSVFERYPNYQASSGGMGYWPGNSTPNEWGTCYAAHFMIEAKKQGYSVPDSVMKPALDYISEKAKAWTSSPGLSETSIQAYRLFVLSLAGNPNLSAMNRLKNNSPEGEANLLLSASYAMSGRLSEAKNLLKSYKANNKNFRWLSGTFGSDFREMAIYMYASNAAKNENISARLAKSITKKLSSDNWMSTQETAWALYSLLPFYTEQQDGEASYEVSANNAAVLGKMTESVSIEELKASKTDEKQTATVKNTGKRILYGTLISSGMSLPGKEIKSSSGISMTVTQTTAQKTGDNVEITVKIRNSTGRQLDNLALTIPVATCYEFTNERLSAGSDWSSSSFDYQDFRDDAIYTYFDLEDSETKSFKFTATAAFSGNFYIPSIHCEAMYDNSISAVEPGKYVQIK